MSNAAFILGATGRTGRAIAADLHGWGIPVVLAGRDRTRLKTVAEELGSGSGADVRVVVGSFDAMLETVRTEGPGVVVNTVGPFTRTAVPVVRALPAGSHYLDLSNEYSSIDDLLRLDRTVARAGQSVLPGAGFGVTATESLVVRLCEGAPRPTRVHVDAMASLASEAGTVGTALAESIAAVAAFGGGSIRGGRFVPTRGTVSGTQTLTTPDGDTVTTATGPSGELRAAWFASDADEVTAGSMLAPTSPFVRPVLPVLTTLFRIAPIRRFAVSRIAGIAMQDRPMARPHSWAHARVEWASGTVRHGWLRLGDAEEHTTRMASEVAARLLRGEGTPGASTPAAMFGPGLVESVGAEYVDATGATSGTGSEWVVR